MLMPAAWSQSAYAAIDMGEILDEPIVEYVTRSMSEMRALYGGLLLQLASNVHRCHQIIMYQAVGILVVAACATMLMYRLPIIGNYILLDCIPSLWLQTRLKEL